MLRFKTNMAISIGSISNHSNDSEYWIDDIKKDQINIDFQKIINEPKKKKSVLVRYKIDVGENGEINKSKRDLLKQPKPSSRKLALSTS